MRKKKLTISNIAGKAVAKQLTACEVDRDRYEAVYYAARGICYGYDWNNGTHASKYRKKLLGLVNGIEVIPDIDCKALHDNKED